MKFIHFLLATIEGLRICLIEIVSHLSLLQEVMLLSVFKHRITMQIGVSSMPPTLFSLMLMELYNMELTLLLEHTYA